MSAPPLIGITLERGENQAVGWTILDTLRYAAFHPGNPIVWQIPRLFYHAADSLIGAHQVTARKQRLVNKLPALNATMAVQGAPWKAFLRARDFTCKLSARHQIHLDRIRGMTPGENR